MPARGINHLAINPRDSLIIGAAAPLLAGRKSRFASKVRTETVLERDGGWKKKRREKTQRFYCATCPQAPCYFRESLQSADKSS